MDLPCKEVFPLVHCNTARENIQCEVLSISTLHLKKKKKKTLFNISDFEKYHFTLIAVYCILLSILK